MLKQDPSTRPAGGGVALGMTGDAEWIATDISAEALTVARANADALGCADVCFFEGNLFAPVAGRAPFDMILFNPPYIPTGEIPALEPEIRDWEPLVALDGGSDGLDFYRRLAAEAPKHLAPGGRLLVEIGDGQFDPVARIFQSGGLRVTKAHSDFSGTPRVVGVTEDSPLRRGGAEQRRF